MADGARRRGFHRQPAAVPPGVFGAGSRRAAAADGRAVRTPRRRRQGLSPDRGRGGDLAEASGAGDRTPELRSAAMSETDERNRRWTLALGVDPDAESGFALSDSDRRMSDALTALYGDGDDAPKKGRGGLGGSAPRVAKWLGDIREFFPASVVQVIQRDAFERLGLKAMLVEPALFATLEAAGRFVADLIALRAAMPAKAKDTARQVVRKVVDDLMQKLAQRTAE